MFIAIVKVTIDFFFLKTYNIVHMPRSKSDIHVLQLTLKSLVNGNDYQQFPNYERGTQGACVCVFSESIR